MRKRFATPLLLLTLVLLSSSDRSNGVAAALSPATNPPAQQSSAARVSRSSDGATAAAITTTSARRTNAAGGARTSSAAIGADDNAVLAEIAELQLLADGTDLTLTSEQWTAFAAATLECQAVRLNYEAQIAKAAPSLANGTARLEIPMYAEAGDALRQRFEARLGEQVGVDTAAEILAKLDGKIEGHFAGFGVAEQTLEIRGDPRGTDCEVTRTVKYWNAADGGERLSARRETHLPAFEDPSGANWAPLLARVGA